MFDSNEFLANEIRNKILNVFPNITVNTYYDSDRDEYSVSINEKELYYSDVYQILVLEIKQELLWAKNLYNFYFTLDEVSCENMKLLATLTMEYSYSLNFSDYLTELPKMNIDAFQYLIEEDQQLAA